MTYNTQFQRGDTLRITWRGQLYATVRVVGAWDDDGIETVLVLHSDYSTDTFRLDDPYFKLERV